MLHAQVEAFVAVARWGNMRRAAEEIHLSQPALTARILALESELGAQLFERTRAGMELTAEGLAYLPHAERSMLALQDGATVVSEVSHGLSGELLIGAAAAISTYVLPEILARFVSERPGVRVGVRTDHSEEVVDMVVHGEVQIGLSRETRDRRVVTELLYEDDLLLVARADHRFASRELVEISELAADRFILFDTTSSYHELTSALLRDAGLPKDHILELDNIAAAKRMVERGVGVSILPAVAVSDALASGRLRSIRWAGSEVMHRRAVMLRRAAAADSGVVRDFCALLRTIPELIPGARRITEL